MQEEGVGPLPAPPELGFEQFQRIYGRIEALSPAEASVLFEGVPLRWWVAGGWSVDLGVAVPRADVLALREWLSDYHLRDTHAGALTFLAPDVVLPDDHEQLWLRRDASSRSDS